LVLVAMFLAAVAAMRPALAADAIEARDVRIERPASGEGWALSADFHVPLPQRLEEAVSRGIALYFVVEFELVRPRWYWWDEIAASASQTWRLSYHALTQQYRVTLNDGFAQVFGSLAEALQTLSRVRGWKVIEPGQVSAGTEYRAQVRMRLDASMLPKPFQVTAITNRDWNLQAEWTRLRFVP
jgi:hypothetical protein